MAVAGLEGAGSNTTQLPLAMGRWGTITPCKRRGSYNGSKPMRELDLLCVMQRRPPRRTGSKATRWHLSRGEWTGQNSCRRTIGGS